MAAKCESCGAALRFMKTAGGKWMPCDDVRVSRETMKGDRLITSEGVILVGDQIGGASGYEPHWSRCLKPDMFRGRENK